MAEGNVKIPVQSCEDSFLLAVLDMVKGFLLLTP